MPRYYKCARRARCVTKTDSELKKKLRLVAAYLREIISLRRRLRLGLRSVYLYCQNRRTPGWAIKSASPRTVEPCFTLFQQCDNTAFAPVSDNWPTSTLHDTPVGKSSNLKSRQRLDNTGITRGGFSLSEYTVRRDIWYI
jgi:hypothetical protein